MKLFDIYVSSILNVIVPIRIHIIVKIPNVINLNLSEAKKQLKDLTIEYSGNGNIIKNVSPNPGTYLKVNSTIKVLLSDWQ